MATWEADLDPVTVRGNNDLGALMDKEIISYAKFKEGRDAVWTAAWARRDALYPVPLPWSVSMVKAPRAPKAEMDLVMVREMDDLMDLMTRKLITFADYKEGVAATRSATWARMDAQELLLQSANVSISDVVREESVSVSVSTMKNDEMEVTSDVGESATPGKSQNVPEEVHADYQMGVVGDLAHLLYDSNLCLPCELGNEEVKQGTNIVLAAESCTIQEIEQSSDQVVHPKAKPRIFDSVVQQVIRMKTRPGRLDRWMFAHMRVRVIADIRILTDVEGQRGRMFQSDPQYRFKRVALPGKEAEGEAWMVGEKLAMFQMDAVTIEVTVDECVNQEGDVGCARVVGYTVVGIYLGRR